MKTYHLENRQLAGTPACGNSLEPGDEVVPEEEAAHPEGRHFNCVDCHKLLTGGQRHVRPPMEEPDDDVPLG